MRQQYFLKVTHFVIFSFFGASVSLAFAPGLSAVSNSRSAPEAGRLRHRQIRPGREFVARRSRCSNHGVRKSNDLHPCRLFLQASVGTVVETDKAEPDPHVTELPDSFEDSIARMGSATLQALGEGHKRLRVDFDTSAGDETYTTLKNSLEMTKQFAKIVAEALICEKEGDISDSTMTIFFPDAGSAALAKFEWGADTETAEMPAGVRFCTVKTDEPADTDVGCILLCPRNSEAEFALNLVKKVEERGQFMILINPELVNMGTTGYGLAGRRIRDEMISTFHVCYYLRTLSWGAVTREHGKRYSVWQDDPEEPTGYRLLKTTIERPSADTLDNIYGVANGIQEEGQAPEFLDSLAKFVRDFGAM